MCNSSVKESGQATVCTFAEKNLDTSLTTPPAGKMVLATFEKSTVPGAKPYCRPMWYAYRFVDSNGNYSALSEWSDAIYSGAKTLPCAGGEGNCTKLGIIPGPKSIDASQLTIGITSTLPYSLIDSGKMVANVHRQVGQPGQTSPSPGDDGEIIGRLFEADQYPPLKYFYIDALCNPIQNPGICQVV